MFENDSPMFHSTCYPDQRGKLVEWASSLIGFGGGTNCASWRKASLHTKKPSRDYNLPHLSKNNWLKFQSQRIKVLIHSNMKGCSLHHAGFTPTWRKLSWIILYIFLRINILRSRYSWIGKNLNKFSNTQVQGLMLAPHFL